MAHPIPPPTEISLREAATRHLSRYAATVAGLTRVLDRRVDRWARAAAEALDGRSDDVAEEAARLRRTVREIVGRLAEAGAVDDRLFAASRARRLAASGRSRRAIAGHLSARGTDPAAAREALPDPAAELAAALITMRRRRFGAWRKAEVDQLARRRELAGLARAGFSEAVARAALALSREEADVLIAAQRG